MCFKTEDRQVTENRMYKEVEGGRTRWQGKARHHKGRVGCTRRPPCSNDIINNTSADPITIIPDLTLVQRMLTLAHNAIMASTLRAGIGPNYIRKEAYSCRCRQEREREEETYSGVYR